MSAWSLEPGAQRLLRVSVGSESDASLDLGDGPVDEFDCPLAVTTFVGLGTDEIATRVLQIGKGAFHERLVSNCRLHDLLNAENGKNSQSKSCAHSHTRRG